MIKRIKVIAGADEPKLSYDDIRLLITLRGRPSTLRVLLRVRDTLPARDLVKFAYLIILGREADQGGLDVYSLFLRTGMDFMQFLQVLCDSEEFSGSAHSGDVERMNDYEYLALIYKRYLNREIDPSGREHYTAQLKSGVSRSKVARAISRSKEARFISAQHKLIRRIIRNARWARSLRVSRGQTIILNLDTAVLNRSLSRSSDERNAPSHTIFDNLHNIQNLPVKARNIILNAALGLEN